MARRKVPPAEATTNEVMNKTALYDHRADFDGFAKAMSFLNTLVPSRTTARQLHAFATIVAANTRGERVTLKDLKDQSPDTADGARNVAAHVNKSYQMFLPPTARDPAALGWIIQEPDPQDARSKFLVLNDAGRDVAQMMASAMLGETPKSATFGKESA